ncbi:hypothetical protein [Christiangramia portivictoriae]|uniref:hypothetical protein n=1 Tax=Christiangramia portivictoriae TaxID=326069 RepID=UPI0004155404|nr:hypothetical protein [Christiangramia portivictoriae]
MKKFNLYLAIFSMCALVLTGCSKDENEKMNPGEDSAFVEITFGASLDELVNRAVQVNKDHFNQIPTCSDATPAVARIEFSYGGQNYSTDVDILFDGTAYFTDYSEALKIPVANNGTTTVTLTGFMVYDGDPNSDGDIIWIAPKSSEEGQFDGYVDNPLPFDFDVRDGTKPYIDIEVLCYDRRMVNEYGYVFFELENTELINFCIFGNFCPPSGRHYLASYSVNVWTVDENGNNLVDLYDGGIENMIVEEDGQYSADPLCIVLPDRLDETDRYRIEIRIQDGPDYDANEGELIRTAILTDLEIRTFFDGDDNLEYYHFFEGCGESDDPQIFDDPRDDTMVYKTCAKELNDSGVIALASVAKTGNKFDVTVLATNTTAGMSHLQHIHGFAPVQGVQQDATCPTMDAAGADGILTLAEGEPFYGPVQLGLSVSGDQYPVADANGNYIYERVFTLSADEMENLTSLDKNVIVIHGLDGNATLPVACGELSLVQ